MAFWNWLKEVFLPPSGGSTSHTDSQLAWTSASCREDGSDVFNDSYFCGSGSGRGACSKDSGESADDGGDSGD
ncbi:MULTISPECIES: hypothetical protein [Comamonas]|jgi:hypothetical protein|uniref:hypothetical protein n=1 Tax=Comamonas TaxID=283 RepID=UPI0012C7C54E|nr:MULTISPECIES: hypothetical protein [Comamonas]MDR3067766.1 hypothetical protein [Comamonas sp.]MEB5966873.1 hypothetical protein [Comamonas testosteroni]MPS95168.1 hypothetical protein [Comamonas sp.]